MERLLATALVAVCTPAFAQTTHYVDLRGACGGLSPCHATIMDAVDAAADGDTVSIFPGRYSERVEIVGRTGLKLVGRSPDPRICTTEPRHRAELAQELHLDQYAGLRVENLVLLGGARALRTATDGPASVFARNEVHGRWYVHLCFGVTLRENAFAGDAPLDVNTDARCGIHDNSFDTGGIHLTHENNSADSVIAGNVLRSGDIEITSERVRRLRIVQNRLFAGDLVIDAREPQDNLIEGNVLNAGSLRVAGETGSGNVIRSNRVFDSDGNGIELALRAQARNEVTDNTSRGHAGCDIVDAVLPGVDNDWSGNDYDTACGAADG